MLGELPVLLALVDEYASPQVGAAFVEQRDPLFDALQGLNDLTLEPDEHRHGVLVGAAADLLGVGLRAADDALALVISGLGQATLIDQERGLFLGAGDDPLRLLLRLVDDPFALGVDSLCRTDLLGDGNAQLVDQAERGVLVDDDVGGQGQLLAVGDQRFEALDQEDDVDRRVLRERGLGWRGLSHAFGAAEGC